MKPVLTGWLIIDSLLLRVIQKRLLESVSNQLDLADISKEGRPAISEEELDNYINALKGERLFTCGWGPKNSLLCTLLRFLQTTTFNFLRWATFYLFFGVFVESQPTYGG
jgi:hypothetical protein